jgi:ribose transport system substrate-binding protein
MIIQTHPDLKGLFGADEGTTIGILDAVHQLGKDKKVVVIGFDSGKQQIEAVRSGIQAGAIAQDPVGIGYKTVEAAVKILKGEKLPKRIDAGYHWYDATNLDSPEIKPLLHQ